MPKLTAADLVVLRGLVYQQKEGYPPSPMPTKTQLEALWLKLDELYRVTDENERRYFRFTGHQPETD